MIRQHLYALWEQHQALSRFCLEHHDRRHEPAMLLPEALRTPLLCDHEETVAEFHAAVQSQILRVYDSLEQPGTPVH